MTISGKPALVALEHRVEANPVEANPVQANPVQAGLIEAGPIDVDVSSERESELDHLAKTFKRLFRNLRRLRGRDTHASGSEVTHAQLELLIELYERGPLSAGELASAAQLTPATVTQMLDHLATGGHVERTRSSQDRRIVVTRLTALGKRRVNAKHAQWQLRWREALSGMDVQELRIASEALERLAAMFDDMPGGCG